MKLLRKHYHLLKHISKCSSAECSHIIKGLSDEVIRLMSQICINVMNKNLLRNESDAVKRLTPYKKELKAVTRHKATVKQKRKTFEQKGGFLGTILGLALPLITGLIGARR